MQVNANKSASLTQQIGNEFRGLIDSADTVLLNGAKAEFIRSITCDTCECLLEVGEGTGFTIENGHPTVLLQLAEGKKTVGHAHYKAWGFHEGYVTCEDCLPEGEEFE